MSCGKSKLSKYYKELRGNWSFSLIKTILLSSRQLEASLSIVIKNLSTSGTRDKLSQYVSKILILSLFLSPQWCFVVWVSKNV